MILNNTLNFAQYEFHELLSFITDVRDKMTAIKTPILEKYTFSITAVNDDMVTSDFSNMHQTSTGVFSKQTTSSKSEWKTSEMLFSKHV